MLRSRRWTSVSRHIVQNREQLRHNAIALRQIAAIRERDPGALVLSVSALDLFVNALLHLALEYAGAGGLVEASCFQDMCCIDPVIHFAAHDVHAWSDAEFVYWNLVLSVS